MYLVRGGLRGPGDGAPSDEGGGRPATGLLLTEPIRGLADLAALLLAAPALLAAPRGDGHGVLVFPGLLAGDTRTMPLRAFLRWLGYDVRGWALGRNQGPTEAVLTGLPRAVLDHAERTGRPVSLIGWSLGGIYAREMARRHPRKVRQVITMGSPYAMRDPLTCRPLRSTPAGTVWCPGRCAWSRRRRCTRTSRSGAATSASVWTRRR